MCFPIQHGFWVVLGVIVVLGSSAPDDRNEGGPAMAGTAIGVVLGAALIELVGGQTALLWTLMPILIFAAAIRPAGGLLHRGTGGAGR
jgi:uncharacterized membrane protein YccC